MAHEPDDRAGSLLLVLAHPAYERSRANRALFDSVGVPGGVTLHDLYERYPDFMINIRREQALLTAHDVVALQFPLYWYAMPALLKEWFDLVWLHGFAYGEQGTRLAGKTLFCITTTGSDAASYGPEGRNGHRVEEFLRPLERTAHLCGMRWEPPLVIHGDTLDGAAGRYAERLHALLPAAASR